MVSASKRDGTGDHHDHQLREGGGAERKEADLHRADTGRTGLQRAVDAVGGVVAVRGEDLTERRTEPAALVAGPCWPWLRGRDRAAVVFVLVVMSVLRSVARESRRAVGVDLQFVGVAVVAGDAGAGVFGVEDGVGDQLRTWSLARL